MTARVIGIGGRAAGDDAVGLAVVAALRARAPAGVEILDVAEPTALVDLVQGVDVVVLVDAVMAAGSAGDVVVLEACRLRDGDARTLSSHGVSVADALALARTLHGEASPRELWVVGVVIRGAGRGSVGLSPAVLAAVPRAVDAVLERLGL